MNLCALLLGLLGTGGLGYALGYAAARRRFIPAIEYFANGGSGWPPPPRPIPPPINPPTPRETPILTRVIEEEDPE